MSTSQSLLLGCLLNYMHTRLLCSTADEEIEKVLEPFTAKIRKGYPNYEGPITVERSVGDMISLIDRITIADSGTFIHRDGRDGDSE